MVWEEAAPFQDHGSRGVSLKHHHSCTGGALTKATTEEISEKLQTCKNWIKNKIKPELKKRKKKEKKPLQLECSLEF